MNFGVVPLIFLDESGYDALEEGQLVDLPSIDELTDGDGTHELAVSGGSGAVPVRHDLTPREIDVLRAGGRIRWVRQRLERAPS